MVAGVRYYQLVLPAYGVFIGNNRVVHKTKQHAMFKANGPANRYLPHHPIPSHTSTSFTIPLLRLQLKENLDKLRICSGRWILHYKFCLPSASCFVFRSLCISFAFPLMYSPCVCKLSQVRYLGRTLLMSWIWCMTVRHTVRDWGESRGHDRSSI